MQKARQIVKEMIINRGYTVIQEEKDMNYIATSKDDKCFVCFCNKLCKNQTQIYLLYMEKEDISHIIIVYKTSITPSGNDIINIQKNKWFEMFKCSSIQFNPINHILVPIHSLYNGKYNDYQNLPKITTRDPIVKFLGFKEGDIIKIKRRNKLIILRLVVKCNKKLKLNNK